MKKKTTNRYVIFFGNDFELTTTYLTDRVANSTKSDLFCETYMLSPARSLSSKSMID